MSISSESDISSILLEPQCACCDTLNESYDSSSDDQDSDYTYCGEVSHPIPVLQPWVHSVSSDPPAWYEEYIPPVYDRYRSRANRITVNRDYRQVEGLSLPIISVSNLTPKLYSFKNDMIEREISVALCSEVWEKANCKKQQFEIEKMLQMEGLKYISTPRTSKRGGGAAIVVNTEKFSLEKLEVNIPHKLEVVWGLMRPKKVTSKMREIIICAFYSPPNSKKNSKLLDHMMTTTHFLLAKYPNAGLVLGGDKTI